MGKAQLASEPRQKASASSLFAGAPGPRPGHPREAVCGDAAALCAALVQGAPGPAPEAREGGPTPDDSSPISAEAPGVHHPDAHIHGHGSVRVQDCEVTETEGCRSRPALTDGEALALPGWSQRVHSTAGSDCK